jgi:hypothetical protein
MNEEETLLQALARGVPDLWRRLNQPNVSVPDIAVGAQEHPHSQFGKRALNFAGDVVEGLSSPAGLLAAALSGGASAAGRAGLLGISRGARALEAGLNAPAVVQGAQAAMTADSPGQATVGAATAALGARGMKTAGTHSFPPRKVSEAYRRYKGVGSEPPTPLTSWDEGLAKDTADAYEALPHAPGDPEVRAAYQALADETSDQFAFLRDRAGLQMEPWTSPGQPYANSTEMLDDIQTNNRLRYFPTEGGFGSGNTSAHPMLSPGRSGLPVNDEFRAIHDYFGHGQRGFQFGPVGERNAYLEHSAMFSPKARPALTTETHGQNSWVNAGPHLRRADGSLPRKGEPGFVPATARPFADQKAGLLPEEILLRALLGR